MHLVWFKRDLRVEDNQALYEAYLHNAKVIPLYLFEPKIIKGNDFSYRHFMFNCQAVADLNESLKNLGQELIIRTEDAVAALEKIYQQQKFTKIYSHQETWNFATYQRDLAVKKWCTQKNIQWLEFEQHGVIRALDDRDGWAAKWQQRMVRKIVPTPKKLAKIDLKSEPIPDYKIFGLRPDGIALIGRDAMQKGSRKSGLEHLDSFLNLRGEGYTKEMSSPVTAYQSCSRTSPYLSFGLLSVKEVFQIGSARQKEIKELPRGEKGKWPSALNSFLGRLRWHCHFMQKLEDEPRIEFENLHHAYDDIRSDFNEEFYQAWIEGKTGFPMVDACMKALIKTGWLNFRMRAMLMSFASHHLWLDWRKSSHHLARMFVDYEPGIHYSQVQMQSATTGINAIRIYNPIKQSQDHDPEGVFIKKWLPQLKDVPQYAIHQPWEFPLLVENCRQPIIDEQEARKKAAKVLYGIRKDLGHKNEAQKIVKKHGSRKSGLKQTAKKL